MTRNSDLSKINLALFIAFLYCLLIASMIESLISIQQLTILVFIVGGWALLIIWKWKF